MCLLVSDYIKYDVATPLTMLASEDFGAGRELLLEGLVSIAQQSNIEIVLADASGMKLLRLEIVPSKKNSTIAVTTEIDPPV